MAMSDAMRAAALAAVLLAGSCAAPTNEQAALTPDPAINHPITVEPSAKSIRLAFAASDAGLMPEDAARFDEFVNDYKTSGNGEISITVPSGPTAQDTIHYFGERLAAEGIPRDRIMVGTRDTADGDSRVELSYVSYVAHTDDCGWTDDASDTAANLPRENFGCAVQHNIAAEIEDPRDLVSPRALGPTDAMRRATVIGTYEKGQPTAATKNADQSVAVSDVKQ